MQAWLYLDHTDFTHYLPLPECGGTINSSNAVEMQDCIRTGACPWQAVLGGLDRIRVISAHLDNRFEQPFIRVVAAANTRQAEQEDIWCLYPSVQDQKRLSRHTSWEYVKAEVEVMGDWRAFAECANEHPPAECAQLMGCDKTYTGVFFKCPISSDSTVPPLVSLSSGTLLPLLSTGLDVMCETGNMLPVDQGQFAGRKVEFGACIKVMHGIIPTAKNIVEFVEFSRLLGVEHFTFYNDTLNELSYTPAHVNSSCVLHCYKEQGLVDVVAFGLDLEDILVRGSVASTNDCVYKRRHQYRYHVQVDTDEFIVPRIGQAPQYHELLLAMRLAYNISEEDADKIKEYGFKVAFFPHECNEGQKYRHNTMVRDDLIYEYGARSKYISVTKNVIEAGPHYVTRGQGERLIAPSDMAIVHHYRGFDPYIFPERPCSQFKEDHTTRVYQEELTANIDSFLNKCENRCGRLF